jgi:putative addiction module component (TIGR02574 family)
MSNAVPDILAAALSLSDGDRASLAYELLVSLKPPGVMSDNDPRLGEELQHRLDAHAADPSSAMELDEVTRRVRQALQERRKS